mmetsp:Transcript_78663/g.230808  ORF Transcript_78663/g.230808 Transcript_78663/m.230808 type:complete len:183 (-) Transcript_78663:146-694(-)
MLSAARLAAGLTALRCLAAVAPEVLGTKQAPRPATAGTPAPQALAASQSGTNASETVLTDSEGHVVKDGVCDLVEGFFQTAVKTVCQAEKDVTCVYVKYPQCSTEDICNNRNGCGFVQDNDLVKFTGYSCKGNVGFERGQPAGNFQLDCSPALTPLATGLIVLLCVVVVAACACLLWCCCCR